MAGDPLAEFDELAELDELRGALRRAQAQLRQSKGRRQEMIEAVYRAGRDAIAALPPSPVPAPPKGRRKGKPEVALVHLSDWQVGKRTSTFGSEIAEARVEMLGDLVLRMVDIERHAHPVTECHVLYGGDFVEGVTVFPGQQWEIDASLHEQQMRAARMAVNFTRRMCAAFKTVHVWTEDGNHGRIGRRGDVPREDNNDRFVYTLARMQLEALEDAGRLVWHEPTHGWHSIGEIGAYRFLLIHGDEIKSFGGGTPAFGIAKKMNAWATGVVDPFHDAYMGHYHQPLVIPLALGNRRVFMNPSIESGNVYAQEFVGANGFPAQRMNMIDPRKGAVTTERLLWLDG